MCLTPASTANQPLLTAGLHRSGTGMREALFHWAQLKMNKNELGYFTYKFKKSGRY
jgi:hypothetical protein